MMAPEIRTMAFSPRLGGYVGVPLDSMPAEVIRLVAQLQATGSLQGRLLLAVDTPVGDGNPWQGD